MRYFPVDYQDFWIAADVNSTWNFANNPRGSDVFANTAKFNNPRYPRQPQPSTYSYDWPNGMTPYYGWVINISINSNGLGSGDNYGFLSCATDTPAFLSSITTSDYYFLQKGSPSNFNTYVVNQLNPSICRDNLRIWAALSSVAIESEYALSAPSFTVDLSSHLSSVPHKVISRLAPYNFYSYSDANQISTYFNDPNKFPNNFGGWFGTAGSICRHSFTRSSPTQSFTETWDSHQSDSGNTIQGIRWRIATSLSAQYCSEKYAYPPRQGENQSTFKLYVNAPTFCYYGDLSADLYMAWNVDFGDTNAQYWKKIPLTFERTDIYQTRYTLPRHYLMRSKETFTFQDLFCLWSPYDEDDAKTVINDLRTKAGLSPWQFPAPPIPPSQQSGLNHYAQVWIDYSYLVWKFSHPLEKPHDYHYPNQDAPN